jgi:hypothetical protein
MVDFKKIESYPTKDCISPMLRGLATDLEKQTTGLSEMKASNTRISLQLPLLKSADQDAQKETEGGDGIFDNDSSYDEQSQNSEDSDSDWHLN